MSSTQLTSPSQSTKRQRPDDSRDEEGKEPSPSQRFRPNPTGTSPVPVQQQFGNTQAQLQLQLLQRTQLLAGAGASFPGLPAAAGLAASPAFAAGGMPRMSQAELMRQLNASQMQLLNQPGVDPGALMQMFAMQNQTVNQAFLAQTMPWASPGGVVASATMAMTPRPTPGALAVTPPGASARDSTAASARPEAPSPGGVTGRKPIILYTTLDQGRLTPYQCLARKHLEYFEADQAKVDEGAQGRNKAIILGQVGIRCIHCSGLKRKERAPAAAFYPSKLSGLYQSAQNIINSHLAKDCNKVPKEMRDQLLATGNRKSAPGGGKAYWADEAKRVGVFEDSNGLRFTPNGQAASAPAAPVTPVQQRVPSDRPRQLEP